MKNIFKEQSVWLLIISNVFVVFAAIYFKWSALEIVTIYIAETVIVGFFNILKMAIVPEKLVVLKIFLIIFFIFHYNFFILIQSIFVAVFFGVNFQTIPFNLAFFENLLEKEVIREQFYAVLIMVLSQGYSFIYYFIVKKEYKKFAIGDLMALPYKRIFIQQFVVLLGGWAMYIFKTHLVFMYLLFALKFLTDLYAHVKAHKELILNK
jgi:hypothetical protein